MTNRISRTRGFTLLELLTVVAIITLLIGILVPALNAARDQAKRGATQAQLSAIEKGAQLFSNELDRVPQSRGKNPFEPAGDNIYLTGSQWLALQLSGVDFQGYVKPVTTNDASSPPDNILDDTDWNAWYDFENGGRFTRLGPYVQADGKTARAPENYIKDNAEVSVAPAEMLGADAGGTGGDSDWNNGRVPFYVDSFNRPILYYAANATAKPPFTTGSGSSNLVLGKYDASDNAYLTGLDSDNGFTPVSGGLDGWSLTGEQATGFLHPLGRFKDAQTDVDDNKWPAALESFQAYIADRNVFDSTVRASDSKGRISPHKPDSFILISAGKDGLYGTGDDVKNFEIGK